jgi:hypothetical protein
MICSSDVDIPGARRLYYARFEREGMVNATSGGV